MGECGMGSNRALDSLAGELGSRPCQKRRGDAVEKGDDPAGEVSLLVNNLPWECGVSWWFDCKHIQTTHLCLRKTRGISTNCHRAKLRQWTVGYSGQLGWRGTIAALLNA